LTTTGHIKSSDDVRNGLFVIFEKKKSQGDVSDRHVEPSPFNEGGDNGTAKR